MRAVQVRPRPLTRRSAVLCALALASGGAVALGTHAKAVGCEPTPYVKDGHPLTAARSSALDGTTFAGPVDATGCDIGIYVDPTTAATINGADVSNATYYGVLVDQAQADITNSAIHHIGDPGTSGAQHGVGVEFVSGDLSGSNDESSDPGSGIAPASGKIETSKIFDYQKNGVVVAGANTDVTTDNNTVTGRGPVSYIAQNGIQYSFGAAGAIFTNLVTDNYYSGPQDTYAAGILLYDINPSQIKKYNNFYRDDQRNLIVVPSASLK